MFAFSRFLKDLGTIRKAILLALTLFVLGGVLGWIGTGSLQKLLEQQLEGLSSISGELMDSDNPEWSFFTFIFLNNSIKSVLVIFLGALFGVIPAFFLLINGGVIGYLIHLSVLQGADLFQLIVKGLLPHGIIEIPAIIIACAFGLAFGGKVVQSMFGRVRDGVWPESMRRTLTASVWIVILLLIAAIIESTITLALLS
ncbi:stage II sporulation protein M [Paenibacillus sp. FSL R7-0345]|uniref:stage II sporulation protein M n=1 Tax=Paenibacillus sp. FSL R7-0345 TaxID=2954535 RepID=UPI00315AF073